jgi:hypothetical protein
VRFRHSSLTQSSEHQRIFGVEPEPDTPETEVMLDAAVLTLPIGDAQPGVLTYLTRTRRT